LPAQPFANGATGTVRERARGVGADLPWPTHRALIRSTTAGCVEDRRAHPERDALARHSSV